MATPSTRKYSRTLLYVLAAFGVCVVLLLYMPRNLGVQRQMQTVSFLAGSEAMKIIAAEDYLPSLDNYTVAPQAEIAASRSLDSLVVSTEALPSTSTTSTTSSTALKASTPSADKRIPWKETDEKITLQMSVVVDEGEHMGRLPMMLTLFKFCFDELFLLFDIPHGGCNYGPIRLKGGPQTVGKFLHSEKKIQILEEANRVLSQAAELHRQHCSKPARTRAAVIDYESDQVRDLWRNSFNLEFEPPTEEQSKWPYAFMWKNTMAYVFGVHDASNEFVLHVDDDIGIISDKNEGLGAFVKTSLKEFASTNNLALLQLAWCNHVETKNMVQIKRDGDRKFFDGKNHEPFVTVQLFMTKKSSFVKLNPLQYWRHFTESVFMVSVKKSSTLSILVEMPGFCKAQFVHGVEGTPLTEEEKTRARCDAKSYSSNAIFEPFRINEPHGRCKFR